MSSFSINTLSLHDALPISLQGRHFDDFLLFQDAQSANTHSVPLTFLRVKPLLQALIHLPTYKNICLDRKSTRLNSSHVAISYAVFCLKTKIISFNILYVT